MLHILLYSLMTVVLLIVSIKDIHTYEIPLQYNLILAVLGMIQLWADRTNWQEYVLGFMGMGLFLGMLWLVTGGTAIGGGDVKLMAVCGLLLGWRRIFLAFMIGCVTGLLVHGVKMLFFKAGRVMAMGPYLSIGILMSALWGEQILAVCV